MREILSRMLMRIAKKLEPKPQFDPKVSTSSTLFAEQHRRWSTYVEYWLLANGFQPRCQECGQHWVKIETFNLKLADWEYELGLDRELPLELTHKIRVGDDRAFIVRCVCDHYQAGSYNSTTQVTVPYA